MRFIRSFLHLSRWLKVFILILFIGVVFGIVRGVQQATKKAPFNLSSVTRTTIVETVTETGIVRTSANTPVYSPTIGVVTDLFRKNGDQVQVGDVIARVKSTATREEKIAKKAAYMTAKADLESAQATQYSLQATMFSSWDAYKNLAENDTYETGEGAPRNDMRTLPEFQVSQKQWLANEASYKTQEQVVKQKAIALQSANLAYQSTIDADILSPSDGTIANISVATGSSVASEVGATTQLPLFIVETNAPMEIEVPLSENEVAKVHVGNKTLVKPKAFQGVSLPGSVSRIDSVGRVVAGVIRYNAYVAFESGKHDIRRGMNVDVEIETQKAEQTLSVPNAAIKPYQGKKSVRVPNSASANGYEFIPVAIGIRGKESTQIISGIEEGRQVITSLTNEQTKRKGLFGN